MATIGVHEASQLVDQARKLVTALEVGEGRSAFFDAGYGEGDHGMGQRLVRQAEEALAEAKRPPSLSLRLRQFWRAYRAWLEVRGEDLKRDGLKALRPTLAARHALDLAARLRTVARGAVANEELANRAAELKQWLDRWMPLARRVARDRPELAERLGVSAPGAEQAAANKAAPREVAGEPAG